MPWSSVAPGSAPSASSRRTTFSWPSVAARWSGVQPPSSLSFSRRRPPPADVLPPENRHGPQRGAAVFTYWSGANQSWRPRFKEQLDDFVMPGTALRRGVPWQLLDRVRRPRPPLQATARRASDGPAALQRARPRPCRRLSARRSASRLRFRLMGTAARLQSSRPDRSNGALSSRCRPATRPERFLLARDHRLDIDLRNRTRLARTRGARSRRRGAAPSSCRHPPSRAGSINGSHDGERVLPSRRRVPPGPGCGAVLRLHANVGSSAEKLCGNRGMSFPDSQIKRRQAFRIDDINCCAA